MKIWFHKTKRNISKRLAQISSKSILNQSYKISTVQNNVFVRDHEYDIVVTGLGISGSSVLYYLSKNLNGKKILGIDQYSSPHNKGSSNGETRILRNFYPEGPQYIPIVQEAINLWREVEKESGENLFFQNGFLLMGDKNSTHLRESIKSLKNKKISTLSSKEVEAKYPAFSLPNNYIGTYDSEGGILLAEKSIVTLLNLAKKQNASVVFNEKVLHWEEKDGKILIQTNKNNTIKTKKIILCAGPWIQSLLPTKLPLKIEHKALLWFKPKVNVERFTEKKMPPFVIEDNIYNCSLYGFPDLFNGVKIGPLNLHEVIPNPEFEKSHNEEHSQLLSTAVNSYLPNLEKKYFKYEICKTTRTPDVDFIIDFYKKNKNVLIVSACSGHGFKFGPALGKIVFEMIENIPSKWNVSKFNLNRLNIKN